MSGADFGPPPFQVNNPWPEQEPRRQEPLPLGPLAPTESPDAHAARIARLQNVEAEREREFMASFRIASREDPEVAGEVQRIAKQLDIDPALAGSNIDVARQTLKEQSLRYNEMEQRYPVLLQQLRQTRFVRVAHNDLDNLRATEGTFEMLGRKWDAGTMTNERGYIGVRQALGLATQEEADRADEIDVLLGVQLQGDDGFMAATSEVLGQMSQTLPIALGAGAVVGTVAAPAGPGALAAASVAAGAATFTVTGAIGMGNAYRDMRRRGIPHEVAAVHAFGSGAMEGALETFGQEIGAAPFKKALTSGIAKGAAKTLGKELASSKWFEFVKDYAKVWAGETGTELAQDVTGFIAESAAAKAAEQQAPGTVQPGQALGEQMWQTFEKVGKAMAVLALPGPGLRLMTDAQRSEQAQQFGEAMAQARQLAAESKVIENDPDAYAGAVTEMFKKAGGDGQVYIAAQQVLDAFAQQDEKATSEGRVERSFADRAEIAMPGIVARAKEAAKTGDDIAMPAGDFIGKLPKEVGEVLAPHIRATRAAMSPAEAEAQKPEELAKEAEKTADKAVKDHEQWVAEAQEVEAGAFEQLRGTKMPVREAKVNALLWRTFIETQAEGIDETPKQFAGRYTLEVQKGEAAAEDGKVIRGFFSRADNALRITLTPDANLSTFAHEAGHAFLEIYGDLAAQKVHPRLVDDFQTLLDWGGVKDVEQWRAMSSDERRALHEKFAREWEGYLYRGEAPTPGLRSLFGRFSAFLRRVYDSLKSIAGVGESLPQDVRAVFDRMLASEQSVRTTQAVRGAVPVFQTQAESGMDDATWAKHRDMQRQQDEEAITELQRARLRDLRFAGALKAAKIAELSAQEKRVREGVRIATAQDLARQPVYRAQTFLKSGEWTTKDGAKIPHQGEHKLDRDIVMGAGWFGDMTAEEAADKMRTMVKVDGLNPDTVAQMFGFDSGEGMVRSILAAPPIENAIETRTTAEMLAKHGELSDPRKVAKAVDEAIHNDVALRFVADELRALMKATEPVRVTLAAAKRAAEIALGNRKVRDLAPGSFIKAAQRASEESLRLLKEGDTIGAWQAKRRQLVQTQMAILAVPTRREIEAAVAQFGKFDDSDLALGKTREIELVYAGRALAAKYKLGPPIPAGQRTDLTNAALDTVQREQPGIWQRLKPLLDLAGTGLDYRDTSLSLFREVGEVAKWLWEQARTERLVEIEGKKVALQAQVEKLTGSIGALPPRPPSTRAPEGESASPLGKGVLRAWGMLAGLKRMESWARYMDGGKEGPMYQTFVAPVMRDAAVYREAQAKVTRALHEIIVGHQEASGAWWDTRIEAKELGFTFAGKREVLGAMLHTLNRSNKGKLLLGRKGVGGVSWGSLVKDEATGEMVLDSSKWDRFIADLWTRGVLNKGDAKFLESITGAYADLLPLAQKVHRELYGTEFATIELQDTTMPDGTVIKGGYVPARVDRDLVEARVDTIDGLEDDFRYSLADTGRAFTLARNPNFNKPLSISLAKIVGGLQDELRFIYLQPTVKNALRVVKNQDFAASLNAYDKEAIPGIIMPFLENTAMQATSRRSKSPFVDSAATLLRSATSLVALGFNFTNALVQITGLSNAASQVKGVHMREALVHWTKGPRDAFDEMVSKSMPMAQKYDLETRKLSQAISNASDPALMPRAKAVRETLARWAFLPQRAVQSVADVVTWHGGYLQAVAEGKAEAGAIESADAAVRRSQGGANPEDLAAYEASTPLVKLFTQMGTYSNSVLNQILSASGWGEKAKAFGWALLLPAIMEGAMRTVLAGGQDDKDKDGAWLDDLGASLGKNVARNVAGLLPGAGPMLLALADSEGERIIASPASSVLQTLFRGVTAIPDFLPGGDVPTGSDVRNLTSFLSVMTGLPLTPVGKAAGYVVDERQKPASGAVDYARGLVIGR